MLIALSGPNTRIEAKFSIGAAIKAVLLYSIRLDRAATIPVINPRRENWAEFEVWVDLYTDKDDCSNWRYDGGGNHARQLYPARADLLTSRREKGGCPFWIHATEREESLFLSAQLAAPSNSRFSHVGIAKVRRYRGTRDHRGFSLKL